MAENLRSKIKQLEYDVTLKENLISNLQVERLKIEPKIAVLEKRVVELEAKNLELNDTVSRLRIERPKIPPVRLISSFGDALYDMQASLESKKGRTKYLVSDLNINLKANVSYDNDQIHFQLPKLDDTIPPENLSTIRFRIKSIPEVGADMFEYEEVPDLIGLSMNKGVDLIAEKGFKLGEVEYKYTDRLEPDTIVGQMPSSLSFAPPDGLIDVVVSKHAMTKVPNFAGHSIGEAEKSARSVELAIGDIAKRMSNSPKGTVISQSVSAGVEVEHGSSIDLVIAEKRKTDETERIRGMAGIGSYHSDKLEKIGVRTVRELADTPVPLIRDATGLPDRVIENWKTMASIHNEEMGKSGAYLLTKVGNVRSVEDLTDVDPSKLYSTLKSAIIKGKVRVPPGFSLSKEDVARWIKRSGEG